MGWIIVNCNKLMRLEVALNTFRLITRFFLVTAMLLGFVGTAQAVPPNPSHFYGEIHVLDNPPIIGSIINAYVPGVVAPAGSTTVTESGGNLVYSMDVKGDDTDSLEKDGGLEGDTVTFRFGSRILGTWVWHSGTDVHLNFHPPQADAGGTYNGNEGSPITFSGSAQDLGLDIATYEWDMDSDPLTFEITGQNPVITFPNSGTFTVRLWVTDSLVGEGFSSATVNVANLAPTLTVYNAVTTVNEGTVANNGGSYFDPGDDLSTITASVGTVTNHGDGTWAWQYTPTDGPDQTQLVTITATDVDGGVGTATFNLVVNNVGPVGTLANNGPVNEGSPVTISFSGQGDASSEDLAAGFHYAFACDNGSLAGATYANSSTNSSTTCTFTEPPVLHDVRARIIDKDDGFTEHTTTVIVGNAPPTATADLSTVTVDEGSPAANTGTFADPGGDSVTLSASVGTVTITGPNTWSWAYTPLEGPGDGGTVVINANDGQGGAGGTTFALVVNNVAPTAFPGDSYTVNEGSPVNFVGSGYDPSPTDLASLEYEWDFNYLAPHFDVDAVGSATVSPTYLDDGVYTAALRVIDTQLAIGIGTTTVTIINTPPTNVNAGGPYTVAPNNVLNVSGSATCVWVDTCSYAWDLDNDGQFNDGSGTGASYTWSLEGTYTIRLQVTDDDGTSAIGSTTVTVSTLLTQSIPLVAGWNLVSFNLHPTDTATGAVLANIAGHYNLVYAWDASGAHASSGNWLSYNPQYPLIGLLTELTENQGFWINMSVADTLVVTGALVASSSIPLYDNVGGWNLVGYPSAAAGNLPAAVPAEAEFVWAYHANQSPAWLSFWRGYPPEGNTLTQLTPGWGYWIFVTADSTWNVAY